MERDTEIMAIDTRLVVATGTDVGEMCESGQR